MSLVKITGRRSLSTHPSDTGPSEIKRLRVLLADDHPVVLAGMKSLVTEEGNFDIVGEATDGLMCLDLAARLKPDVAVIDISMPGLAGKNLAMRLQEVCPECRLLTLTVHEDHGYLKQMIEAGVSGYLLKRSAASNLITALKIISAGGLYIDPAYSSRELPNGAPKALINPEQSAPQLSKREVDVLRLLAAGHSLKALAAHLNIGVKTAETYKSRAFEKLGLQSRVELIRYALNAGWLKQ